MLKPKHLPGSMAELLRNVMVPLKTRSGDVLRVDRNDHVFAAALDLLCGRNVLFIGHTGSGKTMRSHALLEAENYPVLLAGTKWENIEVEIVSVEVDLIPVLANLELSYDPMIENGTSTKIPANIADFILAHGHVEQAAYLSEKNRIRKTLRNGKGKIVLRVLHVDDFDRTQHPSIQNSFMKFIENGHHAFNWNRSDPERFMNLQCIASSNSTYGGVSGKYIAAKGVDLAVYNRFFVYSIEEEMNADILKSEYPPEYHPFIEKLTSFSAEIRKEISEGSLSGVGEISLRQLRPIIDQFIYAGLSEMQAARKLLSAVSRNAEENIRAETLLNSYFGNMHVRRFSF